MPDVLLSFCIPTYNRPRRIHLIIQQIISFLNAEIEIIISDDNPLSDETQKVVTKFKDPRIKYFRNNINLGYDSNVLITIKRATGKFIFILMDEDDIEMEVIPWILDKIRTEKNLAQLRGTIGDNRSNKKKPYYKLEEKILGRGSAHLNEFLNLSIHTSGIILRKKALDLNKAKKYIGFLYIQQVLVCQAIMNGNTICTSKTFAYLGNKIYKSDQPLIRKRKYDHPIISLMIIQKRIQIIFDITKRTKIDKRIRKNFINRETPNIYFCLFDALFYDSFKLVKSSKNFLEGIYIILTTKKISRSFKFWVNLVKFFFLRKKINSC